MRAIRDIKAVRPAKWGKLVCFPASVVGADSLLPQSTHLLHDSRTSLRATATTHSLLGVNQFVACLWKTTHDPHASTCMPAAPLPFLHKLWLTSLMNAWVSRIKHWGPLAAINTHTHSHLPRLFLNQISYFFTHCVALLLVSPARL